MFDRSQNHSLSSFMKEDDIVEEDEEDLEEENSLRDSNSSSYGISGKRAQLSAVQQGIFYV